MADTEKADVEQETAAAPAPAADAAGGDDNDQVDVDMTIGKFQLQIQRKQMPLVGFFFASMIFMISVLAQKDNVKWYGYAVSVGVVGMFLAVVGLLMLKYASEIPHKYLAYLCLTWAFLGALLFTFGDGTPFKFTGNGYFSVWAMVIFAAQHSGVSHEDVRKELSSLSSLNLFAIAAIVVIVAASFEVPNVSGSVRGNTIYILVLACLTVCLVGGMFLMERGDTPYVDKKIQFYVLSLFSIMWIVAAGLATFEGPFNTTGNGYFASWGSAIISVFAALSARQSAQARAASS